jgi:hypothetical protein
LDLDELVGVCRRLIERPTMLGYESRCVDDCADERVHVDALIGASKIREPEPVDSGGVLHCNRVVALVDLLD